MSAGLAPNTTSTVTYKGAPTTDVAIKAVLDSDDAVQFAPDHWIVKAMGHTPWVKRIDARTWACSQRLHDWILLRTVVIADDLLPEAANWIPTAAWASQQWMDLQQAGGLTARKMESNEAAVALTRAANTAPAKILAKANTITLDAPAPASWFGHVMTKDLIPAGTPRSGKVFGQYRTAIGGCYNATDRGQQTELINQIPYSFGPIKGVGDIQGMSNGLQARMIARGMTTTYIPDNLDYFYDADDCIVEIQRRGSEEEASFAALFNVGWQTAFSTGIAAIIPGVRDAATAENLVRSALNDLGSGAKFIFATVGSLDADFTTVVHDVDTSGVKGDAARVREAVKAVRRLRGTAPATSSSGGLISTPAAGSTFAADSSDDKWTEAQRDPKVKALFTALTALHTVPIDAAAIAALLMKSESQAGLILMNSAKLPNLPVIKDIGGALAKSAVTAAINAAVCMDRDGNAKTTWGQPLNEDVCTKLRQCKYLKFTEFQKHSVQLDKASIDLWVDVVRPIVTLEDGSGTALECDGYLADAGLAGDAIGIMLCVRLLQDDNRRRLTRAFGAVGWTGKAFLSFRNFIDNVKNRLGRIAIIPEGESKASMMQALRYSIAQGFQEAQDNLGIMLLSPVNVAVRSTTWYSASGGCSSTLAQIDKMLLKQADKQEEDEFKKPKPADSPSKQLAGKRKLEEEGGPGPSTDDWQASYAKQSWQDGIFRLGDTLVFGTGAWQRSVDLPAGHTIEAGCCLARYLAHVNNRPGFQKMALWCSSPKVCITTYQNSGRDVHTSLPRGIEAPDYKSIAFTKEQASAGGVTQLYGRSDAAVRGGRGAANAGTTMVEYDSQSKGKGGGKGGGRGKGKGGGKGQGKGKGGGKGSGKGGRFKGQAAW